MKVEAAQTALDVLREILEEQTDKPTSIRMYFAGAACSGPSFGLALDDKKPSDVACQVEELEFVMDAQEYEQFGDMLIQDIGGGRSEEHTSELQSRQYLVCRLLLEKKKIITES